MIVCLDAADNSRAAKAAALHLNKLGGAFYCDCRAAVSSWDTTVPSLTIVRAVFVAG